MGPNQDANPHMYIGPGSSAKLFDKLKRKMSDDIRCQMTHVFQGSQPEWLAGEHMYTARSPSEESCAQSVFSLLCDLPEQVPITMDQILLI